MKIFFIFALIKKAEEENLDIIIMMITIFLAITDRHVYEIWIRKFNKKNINKYNLFLGFILFNIYNYNPAYLLWFFASWLIFELI